MESGKQLDHRKTKKLYYPLRCKSLQRIATPWAEDKLNIGMTDGLNKGLVQVATLQSDSETGVQSLPLGGLSNHVV
jgi:hypothetical protein